MSEHRNKTFNPEPCPPGHIRTDIGCLPLGRDHAKRGYKDPGFPIYCHDDVPEPPCNPERPLIEPRRRRFIPEGVDPQIITPQGNDAVSVACVSGTGSISVPENFFLVGYEFDRDPAVLDARIAAAKVEADNMASAYASEQLICQYRNTQQEASCPTGTVGDQKVVPEGRFTSLAPDGNPDDVQGVLDGLAQSRASDLLRCYRGNTSFTLTCAEKYPAEGGVIPNSIVVKENFFNRLVDVDANTPTQEELDTLAEAYAQENISCVFGSAAVTSTCPAIDVTLQGGGTQSKQPRQALFSLPENYLTTQEYVAGVSTNLTAQAQALVDAQKTCTYGNIEISLTCPNQTVGEEEGVPDSGFVVEPDSASSPAFVGEDTIILESAQTAYDEAYSAALGTSVCLYGNPAIDFTEVNNCPEGFSGFGSIAQGMILGGDAEQVYQIALSQAICLPDDGGDPGPPPEFEQDCELLLTGKFETKFENGQTVPDPTTIKYAVTGGSLRKKGGDELKVAPFTTTTNQPYTPSQPHFYLKFAVDGNDEPTGASAEVVQSQYKNTGANRVEDNMVVYIGSFVGYSEQPGPNYIRTEGTLCEGDVHEYGEDIDILNIRPLDVYLVSDGEVRVKPGTFAGKYPTLDGVSIVDNPSKTLSSSVTLAWIKVTWDLTSQAPASGSGSVIVEFGTSIPSNTTTTSYTSIANITWDAETTPPRIARIDNHLSGSQTAAICGDALQFYLANI